MAIAFLEFSIFHLLLVMLQAKFVATACAMNLILVSFAMKLTLPSLKTNAMVEY